jgi:hypothetical protein
VFGVLIFDARANDLTAYIDTDTHNKHGACVQSDNSEIMKRAGALRRKNLSGAKPVLALERISMQVHAVAAARPPRRGRLNPAL